MNIQTSKRIFCCFLAVLILCFAVVRPVVTSATGFVPAAVAGFCGLSVETASSLILSFLAVGHLVEYWDDLTILAQSVVNRFADFIGGIDALPVYTYNDHIYVNVSAVNDVASVVENSFYNVYGSAWELGQHYNYMYSINFGDPAYTLVIWTNSNVYSETNTSTTDIVCCTGPFVAYMVPSSQRVQTSDEWDFSWGPCSFAFNGRKVNDIYKTPVVSIAASGNTYSNTIVVTNPYTDEQETLVPIAPVIDDVVDTGITVPVDDVTTGTNTPSIDGTDILSLILNWIKAIWQAIVDGAAQIESGIVSAIQTGVDALKRYLGFIWDSVAIIQTYIQSIFTFLGSTLLDAFDAVVAEIISLGWLLVDIVNSVVAAPGLIADSISDVLTYLFAVSDSYLATRVQSLYDKFPFVQSMMDVGNNLKAFFFNMGITPPIIYIDLGAALGSFYFGSKVIFLDLTWYATYKPTVDFIISAFLYLWLAWRVWISLPGIIQGTSGFWGSGNIAAENPTMQNFDFGRNRLESGSFHHGSGTGSKWKKDL